jgi:hypothetical protein
MAFRLFANVCHKMAGYLASEAVFAKALEWKPEYEEAMQLYKDEGKQSMKEVEPEEEGKSMFA